MASFTDIIPKFNPYIQQLPVDAMVKVGMAKQQAYEQNVTKIQSQIDAIGGLDVTRDVDRKYLQSKIDQLGNKLTTLASGDFSNFQLVNAVGGMTNQIAKDDVVKTAVNSTAWARKQRDKIEKGKSDGTWSIENEDLYNTQYSKWYNGTEAGESFSSEYVPYRDVYKKLREIAKDVGVEESLVQDLFNPDGTINKVMKETYFKGKDPNKIYEAFVNGIDQSDYRQLAITGRYKYKGYTNEQLTEVLQESNDEYTNLANTRKLDLQQTLNKIDKALPSTKNPEDKKTLEDQRVKVVQAMSKLDEQVAESNTTFNESKEKLATGDEDYANQVRSRIHTNKFLGTLSKDFADKNSYVKYAENPLWKAMMEEKKLAAEWAKAAAANRQAAAAEKANKIKEQEIIAYSTPGMMGGGTPATRENILTTYGGFVKNRTDLYSGIVKSCFDGDAAAMEKYVTAAMKVKVTDPKTGQVRTTTRDEVIERLGVQEYGRIHSVITDRHPTKGYKLGSYGKDAVATLNPRLIEDYNAITTLNTRVSGMQAIMTEIENETYAELGIKPGDLTLDKLSLAGNVNVRQLDDNGNPIFDNKKGVVLSKDIYVSGDDKIDMYTASNPSGLFASKDETSEATRARQRLEVKFGKNYANELISRGGVFGYGLSVNKMLNQPNFVRYNETLEKKYQQAFSGFYPQNLGFVMNNNNRATVVGKLNSALYNNPLYTEDVRKSLFENDSQLLFTAVPSATGFNGTSYSAVITSKDGKQHEPIPITAEQYKYLSGKEAPEVDIDLAMIEAKTRVSPDRSTNLQGVGSVLTSLVPGEMFNNVTNYSVGGMDLIESTVPNFYYPVLYIKPQGSNDYETVHVRSNVSLSEGLAFPSILTDAKLKSMGVNF